MDLLAKTPATTRCWFPSNSRQQPLADFIGVRWKRESFCATGVGSGQTSGVVRNYEYSSWWYNISSLAGYLFDQERIWDASITEIRIYHISNPPGLTIWLMCHYDNIYIYVTTTSKKYLDHGESILSGIQLIYAMQELHMNIPMLVILYTVLMVALTFRICCLFLKRFNQSHQQNMPSFWAD